MTLADLILGNYKAVSQRLGLTLEHGRIHGTVDGTPLQMWFGAHATHVGALLPTPAPIELSITTRGLIARLGELFGGHSAGIGNPVFDKTFAVKATDPTRVAALLDADARSVLVEVANEGYHPAFDAHALHLRRFSQGGLGDDEELIERDFREAVRLAKVIGASFARASA